MNSAWLDDHVDPVIRKVSRIVEDITGLSTESAEDLQVSNIAVIDNFTIPIQYIPSCHRTFTSMLTQSILLANLFSCSFRSPIMESVGTTYPILII